MNQSINYIILQDGRRAARMQALMQYSFDVCYLFGDVFLSDDRKACALVLYPEKRRQRSNPFCRISAHYPLHWFRKYKKGADLGSGHQEATTKGSHVLPVVYRCGAGRAKMPEATLWKKLKVFCSKLVFFNGFCRAKPG